MRKKPVIHSPLRRVIVIAALALTVSACANDRVWMRSGATSTDADIDEMSCTEQAESSGVSISSDGATGFSPDRFSNRYACLRSRGYKLKSLTSEEAAKLKSLGGVDREVYWNELLTKYGMTPAPQSSAPTQTNIPAVAPKPASSQ